MLNNLLNSNLETKGITTTDISQYRLFFGFSLLYTDRVPFEMLDSAGLLYCMKGELRWSGQNKISKFDHHNINGGAVDDT
jgi:hypothetical protein